MSKSLFIAAILVLLQYFAGAQEISGDSILAPGRVANLFPDSVRQHLNIRFPITRVYKYADKAGEYYCILTESRDEITADDDTLNYTIKAVNVKADKGLFSKLWEINDHIIKNDNGEYSMWFWTKYMNFRDYDGDGLIDPIIVYGSAGLGGWDRGRIKFIIYYKGEKFAIRHQNGVLDFERETQVDKAFYDLPASLQAEIKERMELMMKNGHAIFPAGWQRAMKNKKTKFSEQSPS